METNDLSDQLSEKLIRVINRFGGRNGDLTLGEVLNSVIQTLINIIGTNLDTIEERRGAIDKLKRGLPSILKDAERCAADHEIGETNSIH
jgi:hypothetical protein